MNPGKLSVIAVRDGEIMVWVHSLDTMVEELEGKKILIRRCFLYYPDKPYRSRILPSGSMFAHSPLGWEDPKEEIPEEELLAAYNRPVFGPGRYDKGCEVYTGER